MMMRRLLSALSTVDSDLPYNWNWQRRWTEVADFLEQHPILLMDVGARGSAPPELDSLRRVVRRIGFEPDPDECRRLNQECLGEFFPVLLSSDTTPRPLFLYRDRGYSSNLPLSSRYQKLWSGPIPLDHTMTFPTTTIDLFLADRADCSPDLLKLDTQGSELAILKGAQESLAGIALVEVEVEFAPMYEGQPLFGDIAAFLSGLGFELLYLNRAFVSRRQVYAGPSRGQVLFGDALFGRREDRLEGLSPQQLVKYVVLLCQYGHLDIGRQLSAQCPDIDKLVPMLHTVFRDSRPPLVRAGLMQVDKVLAACLHLRRYNQRSVDSDRAWPIR
jgi:FkbM family methyltransferase